MVHIQIGLTMRLHRAHAAKIEEVKGRMLTHLT